MNKLIVCLNNCKKVKKMLKNDVNIFFSDDMENMLIVNWM